MDVLCDVLLYGGIAVLLYVGSAFVVGITIPFFDDEPTPVVREDGWSW